MKIQTSTSADFGMKHPMSAVTDHRILQYMKDPYNQERQLQRTCSLSPPWPLALIFCVDVPTSKFSLKNHSDPMVTKELENSRNT